MTHKYEINEKNALMHELIGLKMEVIESTNKNLKGLSGKIIDETKNLLYVQQEKKEKKIPKKEVRIALWLPNKKKIEFDGSLINVRPEERTKVLWRQLYARM